MITQCSKTRQNDVKYFILCTILWLTLMLKVLQIWQLGCTVSKKAPLHSIFQNEQKKSPHSYTAMNRDKAAILTVYICVLFSMSSLPALTDLLLCTSSWMLHICCPSRTFPPSQPWVGFLFCCGHLSDNYSYPWWNVGLKSLHDMYGNKLAKESSLCSDLRSHQKVKQPYEVRSVIRFIFSSNKVRKQFQKVDNDLTNYLHCGWWTFADIFDIS